MFTLYKLIKSLEPFLKNKIYNDIVVVRINGVFYKVVDTSGAIRNGKGIIIIEAETE